MRPLTPVILALSTATMVTATPFSKVDLESLHLPADELTSMLSTRDPNASINCPAGTNSCGVVTYNNGQYTTFGQGICIQLGSNVQSIYVAKCYCSLWNSCTGQAGKDVYIDGMMMCEKPRTMNTFKKEVKYISCGGLN